MGKIKKFMGIDPGASGAIVVIDGDRNVLDKFTFTEDPIDLLEFLQKNNDVNFCILERVHGMPGMGGVAMFHFGTNFGWIEMALLACKIPFESVSPQKWMKSMELGGKGNMTKTEWKNKLKAQANRIFPNDKVTLKTADALLIADYCMKVNK